MSGPQQSPFDWYISPASSFAYETQFERLAAAASHLGTPAHHLTLAQVEPVFQGAAGRVEAATFLLLWQLLDIKQERRLNKAQFIHLMHLVDAAKRRRSLPIGLPLEIKERFLQQEEEEKEGAAVPGLGARALSRPMHRIPVAPRPAPPSAPTTLPAAGWMDGAAVQGQQPADPAPRSKWDHLPVAELRRLCMHQERKRAELARAAEAAQAIIQQRRRVLQELEGQLDQLRRQMESQEHPHPAPGQSMHEALDSVRRERERLRELLGPAATPIS